MSYNNSNRNFGGRSRGRGRGGYSGGRGGPGGRGGGGPGSEICRRFLDGGKCDYADRCRFPHVVQKIGETRGHSGAVKDVVMWPARQQIFTCSADSTIKLWDCASWNEITTIRVNEGDTGASTGSSGGRGGRNAPAKDKSEGVVAMVLEGPFLFVGFEGSFPFNPKVPVGMIRGWNLENPQLPPFEFRASESMPIAHTMNVLSLAVATDPTGNATLFSGSSDGTIRYWQLDAATNTFKCMGVMDGHVRGVTRLKTFMVGATPILASASIDSTIRLWDLSTYQCVKLLSAEDQGHTEPVMDLEFWVNQNETFLISGGLDSEVIVWSLSPPFMQLFKETQDSQVTSLCGSTDANQSPILLIGMTVCSLDINMNDYAH